LPRQKIWVYRDRTAFREQASEQHAKEGDSIALEGIYSAQRKAYTRKDIAGIYAAQKNGYTRKDIAGPLRNGGIAQQGLLKDYLSHA
jgi:hypothetical protein